ncbi:hypothetical protein CRYUN_Cryun12cG0136100 [Craigia yunnanensis]
MQVILVLVDDLTNLALITTFAYLDATILLFWHILELDNYLSLDSISCILFPYIWGEEHYNIACCVLYYVASTFQSVGFPTPFHVTLVSILLDLLKLIMAKVFFVIVDAREKGFTILRCLWESITSFTIVQCLESPSLPASILMSPANVAKKIYQPNFNASIKVLSSLLGRSANFAFPNMTLFKMYGDFQNDTLEEHIVRFGVME